MNKTLACSVILYFPRSDVLDNIATYIQDVDFLYVVDNGGGKHVSEALYEKYTNKIEIIRHETNQGIAKSLNEVLQRCNGKFDLLMTMDQDSSFANNAMYRYRNGLENIDWEETFGVAPEITLKDKGKTGNNICTQDVPLRWSPVARCITSGNIISVSKALSIKGFDESLFIDEVDHEICFRASLHGWKHFRTAGVTLWHCLGCTVEKRILGFTVHIMGHPKIRKYYIARNRLIVWNKYHKFDEKFFFRMYIIGLIWEFSCICFFESDKIGKIRFFLKGVRDAFKNKTGKMNK